MPKLFLKGSFEDEGLNNFEVQILSNLAKRYNLPLAFKIGGCEAKSDITTALNYGASCIVAPMVESEFAAQKFISATDQHLVHICERNINIETITAVENIDKILRNNHKFLSGVVLGRTDLCLSLGATKKEVDSIKIMELVKKSLKVAKSYGLTTTMGGSVNANSIEHIANLFHENLLDRFETRKVIMTASDDVNELKRLLNESFEIENVFLKRTLYNYDVGQKLANLRIDSINQRG